MICFYYFFRSFFFSWMAVHLNKRLVSEYSFGSRLWRHMAMFIYWSFCMLGWMLAQRCVLDEANCPETETIWCWVSWKCILLVLHIRTGSQNFFFFLNKKDITEIADDFRGGIIGTDFTTDLIWSVIPELYIFIVDHVGFRWKRNNELRNPFFIWRKVWSTAS